MNRNWINLGVVATLLAAACNPYEDAVGGSPTVLVVTATEGSYGANSTGTAGAGGAWTVEVPSTCVDVDEVYSDYPIIIITLNKQIDALSVQTSLEDCTPAPTGTGGAEWLTVSQAPPIDMKWYSCYQPTSPTASEGGSIVIFLGDAPAGDDGTTLCEDETITAPPGYDGFLTDVIGDPVDFTDYQITGTVSDYDGNTLDLDVTARVDPDAGPVANYFATATDATSITLSWVEGDCNDAVATEYVIYEPDADGDYTVVVAVVPPGDQTFQVTGLTADDLQTYAVFTRITVDATAIPPVTVEEQKAEIANVQVGFTGATAPTVAPATPSNTVPANAVTLTWAAVTGATGYDVVRTSVSTGISSTIRSNLTNSADINDPPETYTDTSAGGGATYTYAIVPRKSVTVAGAPVVARGALGPASASILTKPARPAAPSYAAVQDTSMQVRWPRLSGGATVYDLYRATALGDGSAGTYALISDNVPQIPAANPQPPVTYADSGLTANTKYFYYVIAQNPTGDSDTGISSSRTTAPLATPAAPTLASTATSVTVTWTADPSATNYTIQRASSPDATCDPADWGYTYRVVTTNAGVTGTFTDTSSITAGTNYWYRLIATNADGASYPGDGANVTP